MNLCVQVGTWEESEAGTVELTDRPAARHRLRRPERKAEWARIECQKAERRCTDAPSTSCRPESRRAPLPALAPGPPARLRRGNRAWLPATRPRHSEAPLTAPPQRAASAAAPPPACGEQADVPTSRNDGRGGLAGSGGAAGEQLKQLVQRTGTSSESGLTGLKETDAWAAPAYGKLGWKSGMVRY